MSDSDWRDALCRQEDRALFFPEPRDRPTAQQAKQVCAQCPVRPACLTAALEHREHYGVWGGMTEGERKPLLRTTSPQKEVAR
jgi:WhiB family redox-sensing transcriptional regulator